MSASTLAYIALVLSAAAIAFDVLGFTGSAPDLVVRVMALLPFAAAAVAAASFLLDGSKTWPWIALVLAACLCAFILWMRSMGAGSWK